MAILGNIIKGVLDVHDSLHTPGDPVQEQREVLHGLLARAADTSLGSKYGFSTLIAQTDPAKAFAQAVPYFDYNEIYNHWWKRQLQGETSVTWPGKAPYYALSSGTTGTSSKRIPVTGDMLAAIRQAGIKQVLSLANFDNAPDFYEKEILMLGSSTRLHQEGDHLEGEISGISAGNLPFWFRKYYRPGEEIARLDDWDTRLGRIVKQAGEWDIGALSGIPSWVELMLEAVINEYNLAHIHEIWPNLSVFASGGVAFGPYEKSFHALMGRPVKVIDTYLASEGFLAFQSRPNTTSMKLITDNGIYFEFVPFTPGNLDKEGNISQQAHSLGLEDVRKGEDYVMVISTVGGAWRYQIGDTIRFTDMERAEIQITGRTKFFLNTVGSQLSVQKLDEAVKQLESRFGIKIPEYTLCARRLKDGFYHCWYLGTDAAENVQKLADALDSYLKKANKNYGVARSRALKGVKVTLAPPKLFYAWNAHNKKKGGQVKMERVMGTEKFNEWEGFVAGQRG